VIPFILFLLIGGLLFGSLYFLARRGGRPEGGTEVLLEARTALKILRVGLLPPEIVGRIVAKEDRDYVITEVPERFRVLFFDERKRIALLWVEQVRQQIISLSHFHRHSARFYGQLDPGTEMRLAAEFAALLLACRIVQCALYLTGPYAVPNFIQTVAAGAGRLCVHSEKYLDVLSPLQEGVIR
jgi:hypothetical protein